MSFRVLILGASGMLGNTLFRLLSGKPDLHVYGTIRSESVKRFFPSAMVDRLMSDVEVVQQDKLVKAFFQIRPDIVINCVGLVKQLPEADDPLAAISINALLPHRLAMLCELIEAKLVHISTDCVFSGEKGSYYESDLPDAADMYGRSKLLGEIAYPHTITLRTSIIGHELQSRHGLLDWFLGQKTAVKGYANAIYSGVTTVEMARIISEYVIPTINLSGLYHVAAEPISKYELLNIIADIYGHRIAVVRNEEFCCDRSLRGDRFRAATNYTAPAWPEMVHALWTDYRRQNTDCLEMTHVS
jgi:dTDP-4-dehydrorhamnose reductase